MAPYLLTEGLLCSLLSFAERAQQSLPFPSTSQTQALVNFPSVLSQDCLQLKPSDRHQCLRAAGWDGSGTSQVS